MTTFYGLDNRRDTLPFFPNFRREDQLFRLAQELTSAGNAVAYLPWALEHSPPGGRVETRRDPIGMAEIVATAVIEVGRPGAGALPASRAAEIGRALVSFAEQPLDRFRRQVQERVVEANLELLAMRRRRMAERSRQIPLGIADAMNAANDDLEKALSSSLPVTDPALLARDGSVGLAEEHARRLVASMGRAILTLAEQPE